MTGEVTQLQVILAPHAAEDEEHRAWLAGQLREELLELDVERVDPAAAAEVPPGARGAAWAGVGAWLVSIVSSSGALADVVETIRAWLRRGEGRSVRLELEGDVLELTGVSSEQQQQLIEAWLERHGGADGSGAPAGRQVEGG
jgi:hypothetical protein